MTSPDDADRSFLARWSQRKQEARQPEPMPDLPTVENAEPSDASAPQGVEPEPEFDLSTLPKLEELTGTTDITAFLRKGVPEHLRNAALRKSWALDPAIRNYVSPALEYAYDWNAPGGVPGGGELGAGIDVARMVSQIMGEPATKTIDSESKSNDEGTVAAPSAHDVTAETNTDLPERPLRRTDEPNAVEMEAISEAGSDDGESVSMIESQPVKTAALQRPLRRHGTAKPIS
jgi:hypothetical protein